VPGPRAALTSRASGLARGRSPRASTGSPSKPNRELEDGALPSGSASSARRTPGGESTPGLFERLGGLASAKRSPRSPSSSFAALLVQRHGRVPRAECSSDCWHRHAVASASSSFVVLTAELDSSRRGTRRYVCLDDVHGNPIRARMVLDRRAARTGGSTRSAYVETWKPRRQRLLDGAFQAEVPSLMRSRNGTPMSPVPCRSKTHRIHSIIRPSPSSPRSICSRDDLVSRVASCAAPRRRYSCSCRPRLARRACLAQTPDPLLSFSFLLLGGGASAAS